MSRQAIYEARKAQFIAEHPSATPEQYEAFCKVLAEELGL